MSHVREAIARVLGILISESHERPQRMYSSLRNDKNFRGSKVKVMPTSLNSIMGDTLNVYLNKSKESESQRKKKSLSSDAEESNIFNVWEHYLKITEELSVYDLENIEVCI